MGLPTRPIHRLQSASLPASSAVARASRETGRNCLYAPSLVGSPRALVAQAQIAREAGVGAVLLAPALIGMPVFHELVAAHLDVPVIAHPAYAGAVRIAPPLLLGKFFRWLGADAVIFPNFGGRFAYSREDCAGIAQQSRCAWAGYATTLPVPAGACRWIVWPNSSPSTART